MDFTPQNVMSGGSLNYWQLREFRKNLSKFVTFFEQNIITVNVLLIPRGGGGANLMSGLINGGLIREGG